MQRRTRAAISLGFLLVGALFNLVLQVWVDYVPTDYDPNFVLWDLGTKDFQRNFILNFCSKGFQFIPNDIPKWGADMALGLLLVIAAVRLTFVPFPDGISRLEVWTRFGFAWGTLYYLRGFTVGLTRFPRLLPAGPIPPSDGLGWALLSIVSGAHPSEADFMFSVRATFFVVGSKLTPARATRQQ
jgi:hypothetical protein